MTKIIKVKEIEILVSNEDFDLVNKWQWHITKNGYAKRSHKRNRIVKGMYMHRLIMNAQEGQIVDHINQNKLDNRRENLRFVTRLQNYLNSNKLLRPDNTSGYRGVTFDKRKSKWMAQITSENKHYFIGYYPTKELAYEAYKERANIVFQP